MIVTFDLPDQDELEVRFMRDGFNHRLPLQLTAEQDVKLRIRAARLGKKIGPHVRDLIMEDLRKAEMEELSMDTRPGYTSKDVQILDTLADLIAGRIRERM